MKKISFNQDWTFQKGTGGIFAMISGASGEAQKVNLPHDAEILTPRNPDEPNGSGNGFFHAENYIYSKDFELKEKDFGKTVFLEFEGVYENLVGEFRLYDLGGDTDCYIDFKMKSLGKLNVSGRLGSTFSSNSLMFEFEADQTLLKPLLRSLTVN